MATKVIIEKVNTQEIEIVGKTVDSTTYSGDVNSREKIKRVFITEADVDESMTVRGEGNDTIIKKVEKKDKVEVRVVLLNAENLESGKSLATAILKDVWTSTSKENDGMVEVFVKRGTNCNALDEIIEIASNMADTETGARTLGKWYPTVDGKRVIIRIVADITKTGAVTSKPDCDCESERN